MRSHPRIGPAVQGAAKYLTAQVPVVLLRDSGRAGFKAVETVDDAATPGGCFTAQRRGEGRGGCRGGTNGRMFWALSGHLIAPRTARVSAKQTRPPSEASRQVQMYSTRVKRTIIPPARGEAGGEGKSGGDYLLSDIDSVKHRAHAGLDGICECRNPEPTSPPVAPAATRLPGRSLRGTVCPRRGSRWR